MPCSPVGGYQHCGGICCCHHEDHGQDGQDADELCRKSGMDQAR